MSRNRVNPPRRVREKAGERSVRARILVIDDAEGVRSYLASLLELKGYAVDTADDGSSALALIEGGAAPDVILLDVMLPAPGGLETLRLIRELDTEVPVIVLSVVGRTATIVEAMRLGASDYLNKPFEEKELEAALRSALEKKELESEWKQLQHALDHDPAALVMQSESMQRVCAMVEQIAETDVTVLIRGESGVGKEVVARMIHEASPRAAQPFVKVNCAALPHDLLESELFGFEQGAFTGAVSRKIGKFEIAHRGTLFLDEIAEMSPALQAKLLHVMQDANFTRLGGNQEVRVDTRILSATHQPLEERVEQGGFREDLFFRLNVVHLEIPPLRERREEIPVLVQSFLRRFSAQYRKPMPSLSARFWKALERHPFPGNVRELENMVKRAVVLGGEKAVICELLEADARRSLQSPGALARLLEELERTAGTIPLAEAAARAAREVEREVIERMLHRTQWNRKQAARLLHVSYKTLLLKIRACGIERSV